MKNHRNKNKDFDSTDLSERLDQLQHITLVATAGVVAGAVVGLMLRRTNLHWSTPLAVAPLVAAAFLLDPMAGATASLAATAALAVGAYRSFGERQKGGEQRRRELDRRTLVRLIWDRLKERRARRERLSGTTLVLGAGRRGLGQVRLGDERGGIHTFIPGKSGSGKTVTAAALLQAYIRSGAAAIALDPKGDNQLEQCLKTAAAQAGVPFAVIEPGVGKYGYNVAARGDDSGIAEKILSTHEWSEPHYRAVAQRFAQATVSVLRECGEQLSLVKVGHYMHPDRLEALAAGHGASTERVDRLRADLPKRMLDELAGARSRIGQLTESDHGGWLDPRVRHCVDLARVVDRRGVLYVRLDGAEHPEMTKMLAASIVLDLVGVSKSMNGDGRKAVLFFDEFAELSAEKVSRLLGTGRSAGLSVLLATQSLADLTVVRGDETLRGQVVDNCEFAIVHHTADPDAAQYFAGLTGTYATWTQTEAYSPIPLTPPEARSKIPTREYNVHPDVFKNLRTGEAVLIDRRDPAASQKIKIWPPDGAEFR